MASKPSFVHRFMKATGRARAVFGPAQSSALDHPMTSENQASLKEREADASQWETVKRPDGSTYIIPKS
ncbi:hypothetical protein [Arthrobacter flavus]|uniref:Uncharacterized protein n=1 Tax=Arthrobacter flavus TaxID=95172 RepID=A0ABW4Q302_9MICC